MATRSNSWRTTQESQRSTSPDQVLRRLQRCAIEVSDRGAHLLILAHGPGGGAVIPRRLGGGQVLPGACGHPEASARGVVLGSWPGEIGCPS